MIQTARSTVELPALASSIVSGLDVAWSNPTNVYSDNSSIASFYAFSGGQFSQILRITDFGFNIPTNAVIDGVLLTIDIPYQFSNFGSTVLLRNTTLTGSNKGSYTALQATYGNSTDLWGLTLTPAIVNGSDFGVHIGCNDISGGDAQIEIDYVQLTVSWHYDVTIAAAEVPIRYDYKSYSPSGVYLGNIPNIVTEFNPILELNSAGAQLAFDVAGDINSNTPDFALGALTQWLPGDWSYRNKITVPRSKLTAELTEFPVYFDLSTMSSEFWAAVDALGDDIRITNIYGSIELPYELSNFSVASKTGHIWFKADLLSNSFDNIFYIYYGSPTAAAYAVTSTYGRNNVWSNYKGVYHLEEAANTTAGGYINAVGSNDGTGTSMTDAAVTGKVGAKAADFDGVDDKITVSSVYGLGSNTVTLSAWAYVGSSSEHGIFVDVGGTNGYGIGIGNGVDFTLNGNTFMMLYEGVRWISTGSFLSVGWHLCHMVISASGVPSAYVDGVLINSYAGTNATAPTGSTYIGGDASRYRDDPVDEVHIANAVRNAAWIAAEYANQNSPSTFYSIGSRELESLENTDVLLKNGNLINVYETSYYYPNGKLMYQGQINRIRAKFAPSVDGLIRVLCHSDGRDLDNFVARGGPFSYTNDQVQTTGDSGFTVSGISPGWERCGQLWTAGVGIVNLGRMQVALGGSADVTLSVYTDATLATLLGSVTKNVNVVYATVVDFEFSDFITLTPGADYFFTLAVGAGQSILVYYKATTNPYANGSMYTSSYSGGSGGGSYVVSTNNDLWFTTAYGTPSTQATYSTQDPTTGMLVKIITDYLARGGLIGYNTADIQATGLTLTASFNTNTIYEAIQKVLDMSPGNFYWYIDLGNNRLVFKETSQTADFLFIKGRHIESLELDFSIQNVINDMLFSGGETAGVNLYSRYSDSNSKAMYGTRLNRKSDNRVTVQTTADAIGNSKITELRGEQYYSTLEILARTMDITLLKPGKTIGFRGYNSFIDNMVLQVTKVDYTARRAGLQVGTLPQKFNSNIEQVMRGLIAEQTVNNPSTPT